jgi:hypothetical protein
MTRDGDQNVEIQAGIPEVQSEFRHLMSGDDFSFAEMWIPIDHRAGFEDGRRPSFAGIADRIGGIDEAPRSLPSQLPVSLWEELLSAHQGKNEGFLPAHAERAAVSWPPTSLPLNDPLDWAAASGLEPWMNARAVWFAAAEKWDDAMTSLEASLASHPGSFLALALHGLIQWKIRKNAAAGRTALESALSVRFDNTTACHLDALLKEQSDHEARRQLLARWADPSDFRHGEIEAEILLDTGKPQACLDLLENRDWSRHHCRHCRTKLWVAARGVLGLPAETVPPYLGEDPYVVGR